MHEVICVHLLYRHVIGIKGLAKGSDGRSTHMSAIWNEILARMLNFDLDIILR